MTFLPIALLAYFIIAFNLALDKIILKKALPSPVVYCFYMGLMSIFGVVFAPFGRFWFGWSSAFYGILVGSIFMLALYLMYKALFSCEASRVGPITGAITPIFVSFFSIIFLGERLSGESFLAFLFLFVGGILITFDFRERKIFFWKNRRNLKLFVTVFLSAGIFGVYYVLLKGIFSDQNFIAGLVWTRVGAFLASFLFLISRRNRRLIFKRTRKAKSSVGGLIVANKTLSGIAFALLNYAISLGNVTIINAMQGIQYVFLLLIIIFVSKKYPQILKEELDRKTFTQKILAIIIIGVGLGIVAF